MNKLKLILVLVFFVLLQVIKPAPEFSVKLLLRPGTAPVELRI